MKLLPVLACIAALFLTGCATTPELHSPNPAVVAKFEGINRRSSAMIVIYRERNIVGAILHPTVMLGGKDLVNIGNGRVFVAPIQPGHYQIEMDDRQSGTEVTLKPGDAVYLKVEIVPGFWKGGGRLTQMAPEQAEFESKRLDLIEPKEIEAPSFR